MRGVVWAHSPCPRAVFSLGSNLLWEERARESSKYQPGKDPYCTSCFSMQCKEVVHPPGSPYLPQAKQCKGQSPGLNVGRPTV